MMLNLWHSAKKVFSGAHWRQSKEATLHRDDSFMRLFESQGGSEVPNALLLILREVARHGASQFLIDTRAEQAVYRFVTSSGRTGQGFINSRIKNIFFETVLNNRQHFEALLTQATGGTISIDTDRQSGKIAVSRDEKQKLPAKAENLDAQVNRNVSLEFVGQVAEPLPPRECPPVVKEATTAETAETLHIKILLVEDNQTFSKVLTRFLERFGMSSVCASDGRQALELLSNDPLKFDALVCDLHMPGMNGIELLGKIRGRKEISGLPIIMLTSDDDIETELRLLGQGADAFVPKNADPRLLEVQLNRLISNRRMGAAV